MGKIGSKRGEYSSVKKEARERRERQIAESLKRIAEKKKIGKARGHLK